jgi:hypothetical protein
MWSGNDEKGRPVMGQRGRGVTPGMGAREMVLVFLNAKINNSQAHGITVVALHPEVFRVSYFSQGTEVFF